MKELVLVDFSYLMHQSFHAFKSLAVTDYVNGFPKIRPTGHVYGTIRTVMLLASKFELVYLCVDTKNKKRLEILSQYKADRPKDGYNIYTDQYNILRIATSLKNVFYVKEPEMEADDLIASYVKACPQYDMFPLVYATDNDIMQTACPFKIFSSFKQGSYGEPEYQNLPEYLGNKYGLPLDYLPVWQKTLKGDPSDKVPNAVPRLSTEKTIQIIMDNKDHQDYDKFLSYMVENHPAVLQKYPKFKEQTKLNYDVVLPVYQDILNFKYKKVESESTVSSLLDKYQLVSFKEQLGV